MPLLTARQNTVFKKTTAPSFLLSLQDKFAVPAGQVFEVDHAFPVGKHCWVKLRSSLGSVGQIGYFYLPHVEVALSEVRGVWLTYTDSDLLESPANIQRGLQQLAALKFNTLYPIVWARGYTFYPSPITQSILGAATIPYPTFTDRDMLAELIAIAKPYGFRIIPWLEYGLMTPPNSPLALQHPDWLTRDRMGNVIRTVSATGRPDANVWLNPCLPIVQQFMVDLITDLVDRYEVDGIQVDDHFGLPIELGYDAFTKNLYQRENRGQPMPDRQTDPRRMQWLSGKVTDLLRRIFSAVKATRSNSILSVSPNPLGFSKTNYNADWQSWERLGLAEELVLQVYRNNLSSFVNEVRKPEVRSVQGRIPVVIGVLSGLKANPTAWSLLEQQVNAVRSNQLAGSAFFFYETVLHQQLVPAKVARNSSDLQGLFV